MKTPLLLLLALLLPTSSLAEPVPTIAPNRRIVVTTRPVVVDMIVVTEQRGDGPAKTTITPAPAPARLKKEEAPKWPATVTP